MFSLTSLVRFTHIIQSAMHMCSICCSLGAQNSYVGVGGGGGFTGNIMDGSNGDLAVDHYHLYQAIVSAFSSNI